MSFRTCFWVLPQNEHFSRSADSPIRAISSPYAPYLSSINAGTLIPREVAPSVDNFLCRSRTVYRYLTQDGAPPIGRTPPVVTNVYSASRLRDSNTSSTRPYSLASSADKNLSRSISSRTSSAVRLV